MKDFKMTKKKTNKLLKLLNLLLISKYYSPNIIGFLPGILSECQYALNGEAIVFNPSTRAL